MMPASTIEAVVLGLGCSGEAAARLLRREGYAVTVLDQAADASRRVEELARGGIELRLGSSARWPKTARLCVVSPGIPADHPWLDAARGAGARVVSELEFGWSRVRARTLAVTGSHGKSTCVKWLVESAQQAGFDAVAAGNYGFPVSRVALNAQALDWLILEVSSFQLETVDAFRPDVAVLLNLTPNHLDRHRTMAIYGRTKARLFSRMTHTDRGIVPSSLRSAMQRWSGGAPRWVTFGAAARSDWRWVGGRVRNQGMAKLDVGGSRFDNAIWGPSVAAVAAAAEAAGIPLACVARAARDFQPLPHRMETVGEINGILFVNDSKATSLAALEAGLRQVERPVRLIAGGRWKGDDPAAVKEMLAERCRSVYLIGKDEGRFHAAWSDAVRCVCCQALEPAVKRAAREARKGEAVLLSPGCASFDQFDGFEDRGESFRRCVGRWKESVVHSDRVNACRERKKAT